MFAGSNLEHVMVKGLTFLLSQLGREKTHTHSLEARLAGKEE